jgi:hypothetical protein
MQQAGAVHGRVNAVQGRSIPPAVAAHAGVSERLLFC